MSAPDLQARLALHREHARATFVLDEELGTWHGIAWADFVLLEVLGAMGDRAPTGAVADAMGVRAARLVLQVMPLEKLGLLRRAVREDGARCIEVLPGGRRLRSEARETAESACAQRTPPQALTPVRSPRGG